MDRSRRPKRSGWSARSMRRPSGTSWPGLRPDGETLGLQVQPGRRPGYDLTFSAPKGVSLLWAFGSDEVRGTISAAHDHAVVAVLDHLSTEACYRPSGPRRRPADRSQRVHRRRLPAPHQPGRRPTAPHPCGRPQPGPGRGRSLVRPRRPPPLTCEDDRWHALPLRLAGRARTARPRLGHPA